MVASNYRYNAASTGPCRFPDGRQPAIPRRLRARSATRCRLAPSRSGMPGQTCGHHTVADLGWLLVLPPRRFRILDVHIRGWRSVVPVDQRVGDLPQPGAGRKSLPTNCCSTGLQIVGDRASVRSVPLVGISHRRTVARPESPRGTCRFGGDWSRGAIDVVRSASNVSMLMHTRLGRRAPAVVLHSC